MSRKFGLRVEDLEGRTLLSGIVYSLTTDQSAYQVGQPIQITFTETNTGSQPVTVSVSPTDFTVSAHGSPIWESNPANENQTSTPVTIQAGQSVSQTATWDGTIAESATQQGVTTTYAVNQWGTFQVSNPNAPQGDSATFQISNPLQGALTTDQSTYQLGEPVLLTYSETSTSSQTLTISAQNPVIYQITHDGQPLLPATDPIGPIFQTIGPGQTVTDHYTWNELPDVGAGFLNDLAGAFVATVLAVPAGSGQFSADFQIAPPPAGAIVSSVTTVQPVYENGQTVTMTFTETNTSDQAVTVPTGQNGFAFDQSGSTSGLNLSGLPAAIPQAWTTLQPGQSWTQAETWPVGYPQSGPYTLTISNVYDPNGHTATFKVLGATSTGGGSAPGNPTLTTNHADYRVGERVSISLKIRAASTAKPAPREEITVLDGSRVVYKATRRLAALTLKQFEAGRPVTLTTIWNGRPNQPGIRALKPGYYTIDVRYGDYAGSTDIAIDRLGS